MKMEKELYMATVNIEGGREDKEVSSDGNPNVDLRYPKELGGNGAGTIPKQLFAAGFAHASKVQWVRFLEKRRLKQKA
jgi:organic hydroperoxide reductase OsmC/OhrA